MLYLGKYLDRLDANEEPGKARGLSHPDSTRTSHLKPPPPEAKKCLLGPTTELPCVVALKAMPRLLSHGISIGADFALSLPTPATPSMQPACEKSAVYLAAVETPGPPNVRTTLPTSEIGGHAQKDVMPDSVNSASEAFRQLHGPSHRSAPASIFQTGQ
ncbi:hypothetical protein VDGL01_03810 [Verticillium dahliae]